MAAPIVVGAAISAVGALAKEAVHQYGEYKRAKADGNVKVIVAVAAVAAAAVAAAPKAIEVYRQVRDDGRRAKSLPR